MIVSGCGKKDKVASSDSDGDGYTAIEECNDTDKSSFPGARDDEYHLDNDGDGTPNCLDETAYEYDFSNLGKYAADWTADDLSHLEIAGSSGEHDWSVAGGTLVEASQDTFSSTSVYMGEMSKFSLSADVYTQEGSDGIGMVFNMEDDDNLMVLLWVNPNDSYPSVADGARFMLWECKNGKCQTIYNRESPNFLIEPDIWAKLRVMVNGPDMEIRVNGDRWASYTHDEAFSAKKVGLLSWDNDAGAKFDNFLVSNAVE